MHLRLCMCIFCFTQTLYHHTMKNISIFLLLFALPFTTRAQDCSTYYSFMYEGAQLEYTHYNKKGKVEMVTSQRVSSLENHKDTLIANIDMTVIDEKGKELNKGIFPIKCHKGTLMMDMRSMIPQQNSQQSADMQVEIKGADLVFPPDLKAGQTLPDADMQLTMRLGSLQVLSTRYFVKNRKVEGEESVTTPAGTYACQKISYDFEYKLMGVRTIHTEYWYSPKVGMVKSVSYDKKGNEESRIELTKFVR